MINYLIFDSNSFSINLNQHDQQIKSRSDIFFGWYVIYYALGSLQCLSALRERGKRICVLGRSIMPSVWNHFTYLGRL